MLPESRRTACAEMAREQCRTAIFHQESPWKLITSEDFFFVRTLISLGCFVIACNSAITRRQPARQYLRACPAPARCRQLKTSAFDSGIRRFFDRSRTAVPASFDAVSPLPVPGVQAAHYVGDLFPGIAAVVGRFGSGRRSAVLDVLLHPGGHLPDPARVFRIVYLVDLLFGIVDHVVELQRGLSVDPVLFAGTVSRVEYQLVLRRPVGEIAGSRRGDQVGPGGVARVVEYRPEAETVFGLVVGYPVAEHVGERGVQIGQRDERIIGHVSVPVAPRQDEGNAVAAFPAVRLVAPVNIGRIVPFPVYPVHVDVTGAAVVGGEHDDRVVVFADLLQLSIDPADDVVYHHHQVAVVADLGFALELLAREKRDVGSRQRHVEEERLVGILVFVEVFEHLVRQVGLHAVGAPVAVADAALDFIQSAAGFFESRVRLFLRHVVDHVEVRRSGRRGQPVEIVESPIGGTVGHAFREADVVDGFRLAFLVCPIPPQMPFADGRGFFPKAP